MPRIGSTSEPALGTVRVAPSLIAVSTAVALAAIVLATLDLRDPWDHAPGHAIVASAAAALLILALRHWPAPTGGKSGRVARLVLMAGFGVSATAQALEAAGAFGREDGRSSSRLADLHAAAAYVGTSGLLLMIFGMLSAVVVAAAARTNVLGSRWMPLAWALPGAAVFLFVVGAVVFGY